MLAMWAGVSLVGLLASTAPGVPHTDMIHGEVLSCTDSLHVQSHLLGLVGAALEFLSTTTAERIGYFHPQASSHHQTETGAPVNDAPLVQVRTALELLLKPRLKEYCHSCI